MRTSLINTIVLMAAMAGAVPGTKAASIFEGDAELTPDSDFAYYPLRRLEGCIIGNLSTALSDTHPAFRSRLAECFDEMALEFEPHLQAAVQAHNGAHEVDTRQIARYIVTVIQGAIMLSRTHADPHLVHEQFRMLKEYLKQTIESY